MPNGDALPQTRTKLMLILADPDRALGHARLPVADAQGQAGDRAAQGHEEGGGTEQTPAALVDDVPREEPRSRERDGNRFLSGERQR